VLSCTVYRPTANAKRLFPAGPLSRPFRWRPGSSSHFERDQVLAGLRSKRSSILPWGSVLWILFDVESMTRHGMKRHSSPLSLSLRATMRVALTWHALAGGSMFCGRAHWINVPAYIPSSIIHQQRGNRQSIAARQQQQTHSKDEVHLALRHRGHAVDDSPQRPRRSTTTSTSKTTTRVGLPSPFAPGSARA
jgi:hypothetical protein